MTFTPCFCHSLPQFPHLLKCTSRNVFHKWGNGHQLLEREFIHPLPSQNKHGRSAHCVLFLCQGRGDWKAQNISNSKISQSILINKNADTRCGGRSECWAGEEPGYLLILGKAAEGISAWLLRVGFWESRHIRFLVSVFASHNMFSDIDKIGLWQNSRHGQFFIKIVVESPGLYELVKMAFICGLRSEGYYLQPTRSVEWQMIQWHLITWAVWPTQWLLNLYRHTDKMAQDIDGKKRKWLTMDGRGVD